MALGRAPAQSCRPTPFPSRPPASLISIDLARKILQLQPNTYVLVVSHENITNNWWVPRAPYCWCLALGGSSSLSHPDIQQRTVTVP